MTNLRYKELEGCPILLVPLFKATFFVGQSICLNVQILQSQSSKIFKTPRDTIELEQNFRSIFPSKALLFEFICDGVLLFLSHFGNAETPTESKNNQNTKIHNSETQLMALKVLKMSDCVIREN